MKRLATLAVILVVTISPCFGASKISRFAGFYKGINLVTPLTQFKASPVREQGGIYLKTGMWKYKFSFRNSEFGYRVDDTFAVDDFVGTATIRRNTIRFRANLNSGETLTGMIRLTPYGILISQTTFRPDGSTKYKGVYRLRRV